MDKVNKTIIDDVDTYFNKIYKYNCHSTDYLDKQDNLIRYIKSIN